MSEEVKTCQACLTPDAYEFRGGYFCEDCADRIIEHDPDYQAELAAAIEEAFTLSDEDRSEG